MGTYMVDAEECIKQINAMSKTDFHQSVGVTMMCDR